MPYIGIFSEENIQKRIDDVYEKMGDCKNGLIAHLDSNGEASISYVKKLNDIWSIEINTKADFSDGLKFDKEHLKGQAEIIAKW